MTVPICKIRQRIVKGMCVGGGGGGGGVGETGREFPKT